MSISPIELTRELIRFNTINPPGNERGCVEHLARLLEGAGFAARLIPFGERRAQLIARKGGTKERSPLCFTGHVDTVPLGAQPWTVDPFAAEIAQGRLYGRGSSDMKSGVAAFVAAAVELADRLEGTPGLLLVITAGEETGCSGAFDLVRQQAPLGRAGAIVVAEPTGNRPLVGHKGALWLKAWTRGLTAHGSMPEKGENAVYKLARAITALEQFDFNVSRHAVMERPTLNVGTVQGGLNINSVPDRAEAGIDIRTIPSQSHAQVKEQLASYLGSDVMLETLIDVEGIWTEPDEPWMRDVFEIVRCVVDEASGIAAAPYFTDASALAPALGRPPTVILGPGELALAHRTDEYCSIERIEQSLVIFTHIAARWCSI